MHKTKKNYNGGFTLSDDQHDYFFKNQLHKYFYNFEFYFNMPFDVEQIKKETDENKKFYFGNLLSTFNTNRNGKSNANYLYKNIINTYLSRKQYYQEFKKSEDSMPYYKSTEMIFPYHINFAALMFISFLSEIELFMLLYTTIPFNEVNKNNNNIQSIWSEYGKIVYGNINKHSILDILSTFTKTLDDIFNKFMTTFINAICKKYNKKFYQIYELIVPIEHYEHKPNEYDFIYVNWKDRLGSEIPEMVSLKRSQITEINGVLYQTMNAIQQQKTQYIAHGTGFFSFVFLKGKHHTDHYGSCITYSMLELYIMSRLHTHAKNMHLVLETAHKDKEHVCWVNTQEKLKTVLAPSKSVTHWSTKFTLSTGTITYRTAINKFDGYTVASDLNFEENAKSMFKALIYPVYDSYLCLFLHNTKNEIGDNYVQQIKSFIAERINMIDSFFTEEKINPINPNFKIDSTEFVNILNNLNNLNAIYKQKQLINTLLIQFMPKIEINNYEIMKSMIKTHKNNNDCNFTAFETNYNPEYKSLKIHPRKCHYEFDIDKNVLKYTSSDNIIETSELILNKINLPINYAEIIKNTPVTQLDEIYNKLNVIKSAIDIEIEKEYNDDSFFVLPSQLNGAEYGSYYNGSIVRYVYDYIKDRTGGPRGQLAVHPAVGQFIIDNAANYGNPDGINSVKYILDNVNNIQLINGYLQIPEDNNDAENLLNLLINFVIIGSKNVRVDGIFYDRENSNPSCGYNNKKTHVNMIYGSAIPINTYTNYYKNDNLVKIGNYIMIAVYYGSLEQTYLHNKNKNKIGNIYMMPLGGGVFRNAPEDIKKNMQISVYLLNNKYNDWENHVKIYVLTWSGNSQEYQLYKNT